MTRDCSFIGRRALPGFGLATFAAMVAWHQAAAQQADEPSPSALVDPLDDTLVAVMKASASTSFAERYRALEPAIVRTFNLNVILAVSIGLSWANIPAAGKADLARGFRHCTVSSYVANFNSYNGQSF